MPEETVGLDKLSHTMCRDWHAQVFGNSRAVEDIACCDHHLTIQAVYLLLCGQARLELAVRTHTSHWHTAALADSHCTYLVIDRQAVIELHLLNDGLRSGVNIDGDYLGQNLAKPLVRVGYTILDPERLRSAIMITINVDTTPKAIIEQVQLCYGLSVNYEVCTVTICQCCPLIQI